MMAAPAIVLLRLLMPIVQRKIESHRLTDGRKTRFFAVTVVTFHRTGFFAGDPHFAVAGDACLVIEVHDRCFIGILKAFESG